MRPPDPQNVPLEIDAANFQDQVLQSRLPVLVAFMTGWSASCRTLEPVLHEITSACANSLRVVRINPDENPDLGLRYDIACVPTLLFFLTGKVRGKILGTTTKAAILSKLEAVCNADADSRSYPNA